MLKKFLIALLLTLFFVCPAPVSSFDEWNWQETGYDFRSLTFTDYDFVHNQNLVREVKKIGSLSGWRMELNDNNLPQFTTYPFLGLREDKAPTYVSAGYQMPPTLGIIRPTDFPPTFEAAPQSTGDWVHREFTYTYGDGKTFKILLSRLTPAILLTSDADGIRVLDGQKYGIQAPGQSWESVQGAEYAGNPSYFAVPGSGGVQIREPDAAGNVDLSGMDQKWFLMWFGQNTYLWGSDKVINPQRGPASSDMFNPGKQLFPVDMPLLVVMKKKPQSLFLDPNGGVEIRYSPGVQAGQLAVMPLLGAQYPAATETEAWSTGLPTDIEAKSRWWYERLGQFPISVTESYGLDPTTYDLQITDTFTYRSLGHGTPFAPLPPVVALAEQEGFPLTFSENITDSGLSLAVGPVKGVDQATGYTYTVSGIAKYALEQRIVSNSGQAPAWLQEKLATELTEVINAGHLAPWWPRFGKINIFEEMALWSMPWETPYYLGETLPVLEQSLATDVAAYIAQERQTYPPESYLRTVEWLNTVQTLPYDVGTRRESHHVLITQKPNVLANPYNRLNVRSLLTLYTLSQYYSSTADLTELNAQWDTIKNILKPYAQSSDWSTMTMTPYTWPQGRYEGILRGGIGETNRLVAGAIGFVRLAGLISDQEATDFGLYLLNKALISRFAQDKLVKHLYETGLQTIPPDPDWQAQASLSLGETGEATLWRNHWENYRDDVRRPLRFDQFGAALSNALPQSGNMELLAYTDLTPELARFLGDYTLAEAAEWVEAVEENSPAWHKAYADAYLGQEAPFSIPHNAHQIFKVKAWVLEEPPDQLANYLDIPWVHTGDYYYIHKLAETIKAYRGITWDGTPGAGPAIGPISTNLADYPNNQLPRYEKVELTFDLDTVAENLQFPYDPAPPPGLKPGIGITVNALFSPDNWQTIYTQPAFTYQEFEYEIKGGQEWLYPTDLVVWRVRFTPHQVGDWQYKLVAQDAGGTTETSPQTFTVVPSDRKGFVRVSQSDPRYFEFDDETYFPGLGYNMNFNHVGWINPTLDNQENFQIMSQNGIQLIRIWLSQWAIYGSEWNPWNAQDPKLHGVYLPYTGITFEEAQPESEVSMKIEWDKSPCMYIGDWKARPAVKRNTDYRIHIRYKTTDIAGPRISGFPYGFVAKTGGWLWGENNYCYDPGAGTVVTPHQAQNTTGWEILEGTINTGDFDFLTNFFLVLENVNSGTVYVDYVWIQEDLGNGQYGPNIVSKPWMAHHLYMEQRNSYAFDQVLELAEQYGIYIRPVIHEKNERIFNRIDDEGNPILDDPLCYDGDPTNDPEKCPGNRWFYGNRREMTKVRWLQQAWWRYLQARWGYSPNIHSWELLNEGDPWNDLHYTLADEFGKYMHQFKPNDHLVSTSTWHSFPKDQFWANPEYPNVDFADYHQYLDENDPLFFDAAQATYETSMQFGANQPGGPGKPVIRGETGFLDSGAGTATAQFQDDTEGVWLHNFIWGGINASGLVESYWYENIHIYQKNGDGTYNFDHRDQYGAYYNFIHDIPLNNGYYQDAQPVVSNDDLRAWGQKDLAHGCAHLWIQNKNHTWKNVVDDVPIPAISGTVEISGFQPGVSYTIEWWDPYQADPTQQIIGTNTTVAQADGSIPFSVDNLATDVTLKIIAAESCIPLPYRLYLVWLARGA